VIFVAITLCVASQHVFIVVNTCFVIDSVRKLLDTPSYISSITVFQYIVIHSDATYKMSLYKDLSTL